MKSEASRYFPCCAGDRISEASGWASCLDPRTRWRFLVPIRIAIALGMVLGPGSASASLAATHHGKMHRTPGYATVDPVAPQPSLTAHDLAVRVWGGCVTDDGQTRFRPCSAAGGR